VKASRLSSALRVLIVTMLLSPSVSSHAQQVLSGDPIDPGTSLAYPLMPGRPLMLPGADEDFGTSDDVINLGIVGDVDLVVRVGDVPAGVIPPPAGAAGGPTLQSTVAGGGASGQGAETSFTVHASTGSGSPPYGTTVTASDLNGRPLSVYAFGDLDGDGVIGPTNADGAADNPLELQEAHAYAGRQVGQMAAGRMSGSLGVHVAAPASLGGLVVVLAAGAYTGADVDALYTDGTPIYTAWPFFPPLDPARVIGNGNVPPPDASLPSELKFDIEDNFLPAPGHPQLGTPFALPTSGTEPSTDQYVSVSGGAHAAHFFEEVDPVAYRAVSRPILRPAPATSGSGRVLVLPATAVAIEADGGATQRALRLLPVDIFGNVADPSVGGLSVELTAVGAVEIVSPDEDANPSIETVNLASAVGVVVLLDDLGSPGDARIELTSAGRIFAPLDLRIGGSGDTDGDTAVDDGNSSGIEGDAACNDSDTGTLVCDDNCVLTENTSQVDSDRNGYGDCCDGACIEKPDESQCDECRFVGLPPDPGALPIMKARWKSQTGTTTKPDRLKLRARLLPAVTTTIAPDVETLSVTISRGSEIAYQGELDAALVQVSPAPKYAYEDATASVAGITKLTVTMLRSGTVNFAMEAAGESLLASGAEQWQLAVTIGDDGFVALADCTVKRFGFACRQP
jgi:hypothetical protein